MAGALAKDGAVMAEAERRNAEKTLRDGQRELARKQNEFLEDLNVRRNEHTTDRFFWGEKGLFSAQYAEENHFLFPSLRAIVDRIGEDVVEHVSETLPSAKCAGDARCVDLCRRCAGWSAET